MSATQKSEEDAFLAGFAGKSGTEESPAAPAAEEQPVAEAQAADNVEPQQEEPAAEAEQPQSEPQRIAGFTEEELRNLLQRAAKVDELEAGLRKAHGKIGELNGKLQEVSKAPAKQPEPEMDLSHVEEDYPDIAAWVRSQLGQKGEQVEPEQEVQQQAPQQVQQQSGMSPEMIELALMDRLHKGWREKVQSNEFALWLAASGDELVSKYQTAATADELGDIIKSYDAWNQSKGQRRTSASQRLEQAMTPNGSPGKPKVAPSPEDAFVSGFKSVFAR
jgi:hypothetical protein